MGDTKREVARKVNIGSIISGKYVKTEGWQANYVEVKGERISRVNIVAIVIEKIPENKTIIIDDGSGRINVRSFEETNFMDKANIGDVILLIGRLREFNNEKFISPEIIKKIDNKWLEVRKAELSKNKANKVEETLVNEEDIGEDISVVEIMLKKIKENDKGNGVLVEAVVNNQDDEKLIEKMLQDGIIFEIRPGKIKILE